MPGHKVYAEIAAESSWGTAPDWGTVSPLHQVYGRGDDWQGVRVVPDQQVMPTNVGHGRPLRNIHGIKRVLGSLNTFVFPDSAKALIDWGSAITSNDLPSYSLREDGGVVQARQIVGLKVQRMTIASGAEIGAQRMQLTYDLIGKEETTITTFPEAAYEQDDSYRHADGSVTFDGSVNATVQAYSITFENILDPGLGTGTAIQWLDFAGRQVTATLNIEYASATPKTEFEGATLTDFQVTHTHSKGAAFDLLMNLQTRCAITDFVPQRPLGARRRAQITLLALLDADETGNDFSVTVS